MSVIPHNDPVNLTAVYPLNHTTLDLPHHCKPFIQAGDLTKAAKTFNSREKSKVRRSLTLLAAAERGARCHRAVQWAGARDAREVLNGAEIRVYFACTDAAALRPTGRLRG